MNIPASSIHCTGEYVSQLSKRGLETMTTSTPLSALRSLVLACNMRFAPFFSFKDLQGYVQDATIMPEFEAVRRFGKNVVISIHDMLATLDQFNSLTTSDEHLCVEQWSLCLGYLAGLRADFFHALQVSVADSLVRSSPVTTDVISWQIESADYTTVVDEYIAQMVREVLKQLRAY